MCPSAFAVDMQTNDTSANTSVTPYWLLDSSASHHLTGDTSTLNNDVPYNGRKSITLSNSSTLPIKSVGNSLVRVANSVLHLHQIIHS